MSWLMFEADLLPLKGVKGHKWQRPLPNDQS